MLLHRTTDRQERREESQRVHDRFKPCFIRGHFNFGWLPHMPQRNGDRNFYRYRVGQAISLRGDRNRSSWYISRHVAGVPSRPHQSFGFVGQSDSI